MKSKLSVYELGKILKEISDKYHVDLLVKRKLSGGFITITGEVNVEYSPNDIKTLKGNNIIGLKVKNNENSVIDLKITGIKESLFNVEVSPTRYKEIKMGGISFDKIKENTNECKVRIDDDLIFTVHAPYDEIKNILSK